MALIEVKDISRFYGRTNSDIVRALDDVSLAFERGELVTIQGPSGCGKSTLLNILSGMELPSRGTVVIDGRSTAHFSKDQWDNYRKNHLGFVFQHFNLIDTLTALENVALVLSLSGLSKRKRLARAKELLTSVGLSDRMDNTPLELSGGQKQRVAIARALANQPDIILADEPTGSLDSTTAHEIMELLKSLANDKLIIMVTHNEILARTYGTRLIRMEDGKVIADEKMVDVSVSSTKSLKPRSSRMPFLEAMRLSFRSMKSRWGRILTTAIAGSIGIAGVALTIGLGIGVNTFVDEQANRFLDANRFDIYYYQKTPFEIEPGEFIDTFVQKTIPEAKINELTEEIGEISWQYSLDPFLAQTVSGQLTYAPESGEDPIKLPYPSVTTISNPEILSAYSKYLIEGSRLPSAGSVNEIVINNGLALQLGLLNGRDEKDIILSEFLNQTLTLKAPLTYSNGQGVSDSLTMEFDLMIVGITEEVEFLQSPSIYVNYEGWKTYLQSLKLNLISAAQGKDYYVYDLIIQPCEFNDTACYSIPTVQLVVNNTGYITSTFETIQDSQLMADYDQYGYPIGDGFQVSSQGNFIREGLAPILGIAQTVLLVFVFIALGVSSILIAIVLFSSAMERKLEIGILKAVGARDKDVRRVFLAEAILIGAYAGIVGVGFAYLVQTGLFLASGSILNLRGNFNIIEIPLIGFSYSTKGWLEQIPFLVPLGLVILAILVSFIAGLIPSRRVTKMRVVEALREE